MKRASKSARVAMLMALAAGLGLATGACSDGGLNFGGARGRSDSGSVGLSLVLASGETLRSASYTITSADGFSRIGAIDLANSTTLSTTVGGLPAGDGYLISINAITSTTDGATTCGGSASFSVTAHATIAVTIHLTCHQAPRTGTVMVNGTINVCPMLTSVGASPAEVVVGEPVALAASAVDPDHAPAALAYHWTTSSGALDDASSAKPTFTCLFAGPVTVTVASPTATTPSTAPIR